MKKNSNEFNKNQHSIAYHIESNNKKFFLIEQSIKHFSFLFILTICMLCYAVMVIQK